MSKILLTCIGECCKINLLKKYGGNIMKKISALLLAVVMAFGMAGCSDSGSSDSDNESSAAAVQTESSAADSSEDATATTTTTKTYLKNCMNVLSVSPEKSCFIFIFYVPF